MDLKPEIKDAEIVEPVAKAPVAPSHAFKVGDRVRVFINPPNGTPQEATVKVVQDVPGKLIGVELDHFTDYCHSLDGASEHRVDEVRGIVVGKGWWTRPENIELVK